MPSEVVFQLFCKGLDGSTTTLLATSTDTIYLLKMQMELMTGIKCGVLNLTYAGRLLNENDTLERHKIGQWSTVHAGSFSNISLMHSKSCRCEVACFTRLLEDPISIP